MSKIVKLDDYRKIDNYYDKVVPEENEYTNRPRKKTKSKPGRQKIRKHRKAQHRKRKNQPKNFEEYNHNKKRKPKRKKKKIRINWRLIFLILILIALLATGIYIYSKKNDIVNWYNTTKEKIEVESKPEEYWTALNDVYTSDDILMSVPMGTYYDSKQKNTCAVKIPRNAILYAECRYKDMKDYMFKVADGKKTAANAIEKKILENEIAIRHMKLICEESNTEMEYTVYSLDDGKYSTISTMNPKAENIGNEKHPAVAYYSNNPIFDYDLYMYYYIDEETTLHIAYSGPLSEILTAKELGECIFNMVDEYVEIQKPKKEIQNNVDTEENTEDTMSEEDVSKENADESNDNAEDAQKNEDKKNNDEIDR